MKHMFRGRPTTAIFFTRGAHRGAVHSGGVHATDFVITNFEHPVQAYFEGVLRSGYCGGDSSFTRGDAKVFR